MKRTVLGLLMLVLSAVSVFGQGAALTNADVVKLVKLALGDDVVMAKIRQAPAVDFKLETDDLVALKSQGVSSKVITAMLDKSGGGANGSVPAGPPGYPMNGSIPGMVNRVDLVDSKGAHPITSQSGETSQTNYMVGMLLWFNVHDAHAITRTSDHDAFLRVYSPTRLDEVGAFVRLDVNKEDRSLKIGSVNAFSFRGAMGFKVDEDFVIPSEVKQSSAGVWELRPKKPLGSGEFGFYTEGMRIFSFGVDGGPSQQASEDDGPSAISRLRGKFSRNKTAAAEAPSGDSVKLFLTTPPSQPYKELGRVASGKYNTMGVSRSRDAIDAELKKKAAALGADAVMNITEDMADVSGVAVKLNAQ
ncbi:MAG: hypothetical protein QOC81_5150 [Thermoanaerobaculia bacterium]|nr:hypothetical protein [Thermoanaerobaculia bacterium]